MLKPKIVDWHATNVAMIGSDLEKKIVQNVAKKEPAFQNAGKETGIEVWRVNHFKLEIIPKQGFGEFFNGDSYIVLQTVKDSSGQFRWDIYFWLGEATSLDEAGTAAYKTFELDNLFGDVATQHRQVQHFESDHFLELFAPFGGVRILQGGVESGFHKVTPENYQPRLLQIKGTVKSMRIKEVPLTSDSLCSRDVFILDLGLVLWQFNGKTSNAAERLKAAQLVRAISDQRDGRAQITVREEGDKDLGPFFQQLGGQKPIKPEDDPSETVTATTKELWKLSDSTGKIEFAKVAEGKISRKLLDTQEVFILYTGAEVIVWIGKKSDKNERKAGMQYAMEYLKAHNKSPQTSVSKVYEGGGNRVFDTYLDN